MRFIYHFIFLYAFALSECRWSLGDEEAIGCGNAALATSRRLYESIVYSWFGKKTIPRNASICWVALPAWYLVAIAGVLQSLAQKGYIVNVDTQFHAISINQLSTVNWPIYFSETGSKRFGPDGFSNKSPNTIHPDHFSCMYVYYTSDKLYVCHKSQYVHWKLIALLQPWDLPYLSSPWWSLLNLDGHKVCCTMLYHSACSYLFIWIEHISVRKPTGSPLHGKWFPSFCNPCCVINKRHRKEHSVTWVFSTSPRPNTHLHNHNQPIMLNHRQT